ncbi:hypothetical protein SCL_0180 [Sulfuricaulis limicola]|uniref:PepSY domain-containing protein n=1 Tax=Sulfuricaulis limicola TaxID=1620215 RepID=A0A1B4XCG1_9GAMM|nr:hypothetical protein [Sulfuricaulis limicola]BAV32504.1 hypothetical protein SCL_0180 [Sulfuricaulis limicola]
MNKRVKAWALVVMMTAFFTGPARAAEDAALLKDMTSVIALLGLPCGKAVNAVKKGDNDHVVTCQDGNRYRVFLNAEGRVVAEKQ